MLVNNLVPKTTLVNLCLRCFEQNDFGTYFKQPNKSLNKDG